MAWVTILGSVCVFVGMKVLSVQNLRLKDVDQNMERVSVEEYGCFQK